MDIIAAEVVEIQDRIIIKDDHLGDSVGPSSSSQVADTQEINVVGFNDDLIEIKEKLCGWGPQLQVLPIFGMGGIGKSTLARKAYDDQLIVEHFQIRAWVTISQDYCQQRILLELIDSMKEFDPESMEENYEHCNSKVQEGSEEGDEYPAGISEQNHINMAERSKQRNESLARNREMAVKVHKVLSGRRFLIVIDDIWNTKAFDDVKKLFPNDNNVSRIMLTTRLKEVVLYANSSTFSHEMRLMDNDQSWNLFCQNVFIPHELESIGREIARSCRGLPLALVVIARLLSTNCKTLNSWEEVAKNIRSSRSTTTEGHIQKILSLSYTHLPHHLRPCMLYMGGFPEDYKIKASRLIRLWVAECFVKPAVSKEFEDTAEEYLEDLVNRSLIIVTRRKSNGKIGYCSLHDTIREMCIKLSKEEKFFGSNLTLGSPELVKSLKHCRRVSIRRRRGNISPNTLSDIHNSKIRTVLFFGYTINSLSFRHLRLLRVLDLLGKRGLTLQFDELFELFQLRYLAFHHSNQIPRAISCLQNLQTLIIKDVPEDSCSCLSYEIWNLSELRHLFLSKINLFDTNVVTLPLKNLQTLGIVENLSCSVGMLKLIPNLTKLWLTYSGKAGDLCLHNLVHLSRLEKLHLELKIGCRSCGNPNLVVPSSLKKLTLIGWGKDEPYLNIVGPFPNLEVLKLMVFNFEQQVWRTTEEDFPQLKFLLIANSNIRRWETEGSHFPRLKSLFINSCMNLREIPECIGEIPTLELIDLKYCTHSLADSVKRIQEEAQSYNDDVFQVRCIGC